ncbi:MAG TPA: AlkA N-terminal domain-containing protein [Gemmatimonadaceae bacterium]
MHATHSLDVRGPFSLGLTVTALRRLPTNVVDLLTPDGVYLRMLAGAHGSMVVRVTQPHRQRLLVGVEADIRDHPTARARVRRMLGVERDLTVFNRAAARIPWLAPLAKRMRGVRPPRYPTLWEACVNAIVFQQVSLVAASAIVRRLLLQLSNTREIDGITLREFPNAESILEADDHLAREVGLSNSKWTTLQRVAEAIATGALNEEILEERNSRDAATLLQRIRGIGPWTATVILLRGLGRLDVFPMNDSSVARNLALVAHRTPIDVDATLEALGEQRGMLYYHLLLARLDAQNGVRSSSSEHPHHSSSH